MKSNVDYTEFKKEFISNKKVETRSYNVPGKEGTEEGKSSYSVLPLTYNLGSAEKPRYGNFSLKGPLFSTGGVSKKPNKYRPNVIDYTILLSFKPDNPEHVKFLEVFDDIYWTTAQLIENSRSDLADLLNKKKFKPKACESVFMHPVYENPGTKNPAETGKRSFFLKFYKRGAYQTLLTGRDKNPVPWDKLINTSLDIYPIITFNWVHFGGEFTLITECKECLIYDANERKIVTSEAEAIDKMNEENPDMKYDVLNKLERIMASTQEVQTPLTEPKSETKTETKEESTEQVEMNDGTTVLGGIQATDEPKTNLPDSLNVAVQNAPKKRQFKIPQSDN